MTKRCIEHRQEENREIYEEQKKEGTESCSTDEREKREIQNRGKNEQEDIVCTEKRESRDLYVVQR